MSQRHGEAALSTPEYEAWRSIKNRIKHARSIHAKVEICVAWKVYENFLFDMGRKPSLEHVLDRISLEGNYEPSNCRWVLRAERSRGSATLLTFQGETKCLGKWARQNGFSATTLARRLKSGWSVQEALQTPTDARFSRKPHVKHGATKAGKATSEYIAWRQMRLRCEDPKNISFSSHGARGISVCSRWAAFSAFLDDMGPKPSPKHSLDRVDNDGNYTPSNCRWADRKTQGRNRSDNHLITLGGVALILTDWAEKRGLNRSTVNARLRRGWSPERALEWSGEGDDS
jgi:hypothetical protein